MTSPPHSAPCAPHVPRQAPPLLDLENSTQTQLTQCQPFFPRVFLLISPLCHKSLLPGKAQLRNALVFDALISETPTPAMMWTLQKGISNKHIKYMPWPPQVASSHLSCMNNEFLKLVHSKIHRPLLPQAVFEILPQLLPCQVQSFANIKHGMIVQIVPGSPR